MNKYTPEHLSKWTLPSSYAGAHWDDHYVFLSRNRESDCITESNFRTALRMLEKLPPPALEFDAEGEEQVTRFAVRESHWAVGWVEWVCIHQDDTEALKLADSVMQRLESYPVLSDEDLSDLEHEEAQRIWHDCYNEKERVEYIREHRSQFEFADWRDLRQCIRGAYFCGYASELIG